MKDVTRELIRIYEPKEIDWMGYQYLNNNQLSFHHIQKKEHGGLYIINNGALLRRDTSHEYLHIIEYKDLDMYIYINNILQSINDQGFKPTKRQLLAIKAILEQFEREHINDKTKKGKRLIKNKYIEDRIIK